MERQLEIDEENYQLYLFLRHDFFEHHQHSIESRVCASLYDDPLWKYLGYDRLVKLSERSAYYVELEISESEKEALTGKIDVTPAAEREKETKEPVIIQNKLYENKIYDFSFEAPTNWQIQEVTTLQDDSFPALLYPEEFGVGGIFW